MTANSSVFILHVDGYHSWELLFDIDNTENSGSVRRKFEVKTSVSCSYHKLRKDVLNSSAAKKLGLSCGPKVEILNISVKGDMNNEVQFNYETMSESNLEYKTETKKTEEYEILAHSRLKMYRKVFNGPGISYITDCISSKPSDMGAVQIRFEVRKILFLQGIDVVYTNDSVSRPAYVINEINGKNPDINASGTGPSIWLVPRWTDKLDEAASGIQIVFQQNENRDYRCLGRGHGGQYCYIRMEQNPFSKSKITKIALYRTTNKNDDPCEDSEWHYKTENIYQNSSPWLLAESISNQILRYNPLLRISLKSGLYAAKWLSHEFNLIQREEFLYVVWNVAVD